MVEGTASERAIQESLRAGVLNGIPHAFMGKVGRDSDEAAALAAIEQRGPLVMVRQVHSADAVFVADAAKHDRNLSADALVTDRPGFAIGIVTADCAPVLLADVEAGVVAAAHAGWRGAQGGIIGNTVDRMVGAGAQPHRIRAAVGPCIAQPSYEVDEGMKSRFAPRDAAFFAPGREGRWQFDLPGYVLARLKESGVGKSEVLPVDTYRNPDRFHSFRLATHCGLATGGRQISIIALPTS